MNGYARLAVASLQLGLAYRAAYWTWYLDLGLRIYLLAVFWTAVYAGHERVDGVTLPGMLTYAALSILQWSLLGSEVQDTVQRRIRQGQVVIDLLRPHGFLRGQFAAEMGRVVWHGLTASPILVIAALALPLQAPASPAAGLAYAASLLLSIVLSFLIGCLLAVTAFWTLELRGFNWMAGILITFLSGGYVPLWLLPPFFQTLSNFLPFQSLIYLPLALYIGKIEGAAVWPALGQQALWLVILSLAVAGYWKITERKIVVQGG